MTDFDRCAPWLEAALAYNGGDHTLETVRERVADGRMQLFEGRGCALVTEITDRASGLKVCTVLLGGGDKGEIQALAAHITAWAKGLGCNQMEVIGRPGWARALGRGKAVATVFREAI